MPRSHDEIERIVERVQSFLNAESRQLGYELAVPEDGYVEEGGWLNVVVCPSKAGIHASDYAQVLTRIDECLRKDGLTQVLLVPGNPVHH